MMLDKRKAIIKKTQKQRERMAEWREREKELRSKRGRDVKQEACAHYNKIY